jgi:hypothetical protein
MKIVSKIVLLAIALGTLLTSCDYIDAPYTEDNGTVNPTDTVVRKILLEDFTGHQCVNCPAAAVLAHELQMLFPERISLVSIHAGYFADLVSPNYMYDFTCSTGDQLHTAFNITGNPAGVINRIYNATVYGKDEWSTIVDSLLHTEPEADINVTSRTYDVGTRELSVNAKIDFFADFSDPVYICAYLTEDSIIKPQKNTDATVGTTPEILDYNHMHVLRGSMNGTWGEELTTTATTGTNMVKTISYTLPASDWNVDCMHVIVFIYNQTTGEVIQTEEIKLK